MSAVRRALFVGSCAAITGLSYLLSYVFIVIMSRYADSTPENVAIAAIAHFTICAMIAHFMYIVYEKVRRDTLASSLVGLHTAVIVIQVVGAVYLDNTLGDASEDSGGNESDVEISVPWIVFFIVLEIISKVTMEMFAIATIRDWIIEVSENNSEILVLSNTWYYILAVTVPGAMTIGGNYLFDIHLGVTGIVLTLGSTAVLLQLVALAVIHVTIAPLQSNLNSGVYLSVCSTLENIPFFFRQKVWELSLGLDMEGLGLISFGLFMRMFLANKGVTPYTIFVLMCLQAASATITALFFPIIRRTASTSFMVISCTLGKIVFAAVFLLFVYQESYHPEMESELVIITHDSIFIDISDYEPENSFVMTTAIMGSSVVIAALCQLDTLFSNQAVQEAVAIPDRGRYAGVEASLKYTMTLVKQVCIAAIPLNSVLFLVLLVMTLVCEVAKMSLATKFALKTRTYERDPEEEYEFELEHRKLISKG